jgi:NAD(P)-dependent dehydrogenase (short-subunit alcohol dehydrogenase family)
MRAVAEQANASGHFDAVIHNAGVGYRERRIETVDGLEHVFAINVLAPYVLTALIERPRRLVYLSSAAWSLRRSRRRRPGS